MASIANIESPVPTLSTTLFASAGVSHAKKLHGLAMHGMPKYESNFTHLDYVNPNAPKGGKLRYGVYGSFDNLNRVAF